MAGLYSPKMFSNENATVESITPIRKTRKTHRKPPSKISRKALNLVANDIKKKYQKYVNSVRRRKNCKVKSFRVFVNEDLNKRKKGSVKSNSKEFSLNKSKALAASSAQVAEEPSVAEASVAEEPSVADASPVAEASVAEEPSVAEASVAEEPSVAEASVAQEPSVTDASPVAAESESENKKNNSIVNSVADALGLSSQKNEGPKNTGGKKKSKRNKRRSGKK